MAFNFDNEINKQLNSLEPEETDINKITKVTHRTLLVMSMRDAVMEMRDKKKDEKRRRRKWNKTISWIDSKILFKKTWFHKKTAFRLIFFFFFRYWN